MGATHIQTTTLLYDVFNPILWISFEFLEMFISIEVG